jgi:Fis family transcriptional regulator, factor for inversion stimulation protein
MSVLAPSDPVASEVRPATSPAVSMPPMSLPDCVRDNLCQYFADLDGTEPTNLHDMLMRAVEKPLLELVMERAQHNQSRAAQWLGLNRNTLRKKLLEHGLAD